MKATRKCSFCGKSFVTRSGMQRYCSEACQAEARRTRMTQKNNLFKVEFPLENNSSYHGKTLHLKSYRIESIAIKAYY